MFEGVGIVDRSGEVGVISAASVFVDSDDDCEDERGILPAEANQKDNVKEKRQSLHWLHVLDIFSARGYRYELIHHLSKDSLPELCCFAANYVGVAHHLRAAFGGVWGML